MARMSALLLAAALLLPAMEVRAAEGDIRTCALSRAIECLPDEGCAEYSIQDVELPRFVRIDLNSKTITSLDKEVSRTTKIDTVQRQQGLTVLHGTEQRAWSMAIGENSGELTLTASGDGEGIVVFGSCITP
ncbi:hypothetical protein [Geomonas sp.]|uniref:hypothetical protein n=1 Tax=Geomonas sp. TaxID=2651584 RepID=UPI002B488D99|nr:hypothetical protein [Geomonas sp.]HJV35891.1 hypothetical protein [Geomonas sp.]